MATDDVDEFLAAAEASLKASKKPVRGGKPSATKTDDVDEFLAEARKMLESPARTIPPKDPEGLRQRIQAGMLPLPGGLKTAGESILESQNAVGQAISDQALFGLPGRGLRAIGAYGPQTQPIPEPGEGDARKLEDYAPTEATLAAFPSAAIDMASTGGVMGQAGRNLGQIPAAVAKGLGASEARTAVRPGLQMAADAAGAGGLYGGIDAAARGGDLQDIGAGALAGAAGNVAMGQLPAAAGAIENAATNASLRRAARPLLEIGQGKAANKAQLALGKGDKVAGKEELKRVIAEEGLEPIIRKKPAMLANAVSDKLDVVGEQQLGPIRQLAYQAEPGAKVPVAKIKERLQGLLTEDNKGTDFHDDVERAIAMLKTRAEMVGSPGQFPIKSLLRNAQEFERDGYGKSEPKFRDGESARAIGKALRGMVDERISKIYMKRPELVRQALGMAGAEAQPRVLETGEPNPEYQPRRPFVTVKPGSEEELNLSMLGDRYAAARKRYADLAAIEPAAEQLSSRESQERPGLIARMTHIEKLLGGALLGHTVAGTHGAIAAPLTIEALRRGGGYAMRGAGALASTQAGPAVDPYLSGALGARLASNPDLWRGYLAYKQRQEGEQ